MHGVHYIRLSLLGQIVQLADHGSVLKLALVMWGRIKVMMKKSLSTHRNRLLEWSWDGDVHPRFFAD